MPESVKSVCVCVSLFVICLRRNVRGLYGFTHQHELPMSWGHREGLYKSSEGPVLPDLNSVPQGINNTCSILYCHCHCTVEVGEWALAATRATTETNPLSQTRVVFSMAAPPPPAGLVGLADQMLPSSSRLVALVHGLRARGGETTSVELTFKSHFDAIKGDLVRIILRVHAPPSPELMAAFEGLLARVKETCTFPCRGTLVAFACKRRACVCVRVSSHGPLMCCIMCRF